MVTCGMLNIAVETRRYEPGSVIRLLRERKNPTPSPDTPEQERECEADETANFGPAAPPVRG